jgi:hypothetical protein
MDEARLPVMNKSSTYRNINRMEYMFLIIHILGSNLHLQKPVERREESILTYHAEGACLSPYSGFLNQGKV